MPILNLKLSATRSTAMTQQAVNILQELTSKILGKAPTLTAIVLEYVEPEDWIVGGRSLREQAKSSIYLDIKITDETNTKLEKQAYLKEVFAAFDALLGNLHHESYIFIHDVRAGAYGYGGMTQEFRFHQQVP